MLIDPAKLALVLISLMQRARQTYELMFTPAMRQNMLKSKAIVTPESTEWNHGDYEYEGLTTKEIRELREKRGLNGKDWTTSGMAAKGESALSTLPKRGC